VFLAHLNSGEIHIEETPFHLLIGTIFTEEAECNAVPSPEESLSGFAEIFPIVTVAVGELIFEKVH
jgi:hypothetical protein